MNDEFRGPATPGHPKHEMPEHDLPDHDLADIDFSHEEALFREAFARHADDMADEPIGYAGPREPARRPVPVAVRWLAVAAALAVIGGGSHAWLTHTNEAVPGPAARSAEPSAQVSTPTPTPSLSTTPSPTPSSSNSLATAVPSDTVTPLPIATGSPSSASPTPEASSSASSRPSETSSANSTPSASGVPASSGPGASMAPRAEGSANPTPMDVNEDEERGDHNLDDPVPAKADQLSIDTPVTVNGWGAYRLGATRKELTDRNLLVPHPVCDGGVAAITTHRVLGLSETQFDNATGPLTAIAIHNPVVKTDRGAMVGMTLAEVQKLYGSQFAYEAKKYEYGPPETVGRVRVGDKEILFLSEDQPSAPAKPKSTSTVSYMVVRTYADYLPFADAC